MPFFLPFPPYLSHHVSFSISYGDPKEVDPRRGNRFGRPGEERGPGGRKNPGGKRIRLCRRCRAATRGTEASGLRVVQASAKERVRNRSSPEECEEERLVVKFIRSERNISDGFTKNIPEGLFRSHEELMFWKNYLTRLRREDDRTPSSDEDT